MPEPVPYFKGTESGCDGLQLQLLAHGCAQVCHLDVKILTLSTPEYDQILSYAIYKSKEDHWGGASLVFFIYIKSEVLDSDIDRTKATVKYWRRKEISRLGREAKSVPSPGTQKESVLLKA